MEIMRNGMPAAEAGGVRASLTQTECRLEVGLISDAVPRGTFMRARVCALRIALVATSIPVAGFAQPAAPASTEPAPAAPAQPAAPGQPGEPAKPAEPA